uniref:Glycine receptor, beta a n=1 Tax=Periophthalmus magnuspinnatus TaxID=409849 RepID=A0A3B3ZDL5_9GOBI
FLFSFSFSASFSLLYSTKNRFFPSYQLSPEDMAHVPANSTSNILNRLMVTYDPRIRPNFQGIPVESKVNIFINSFGSIQETTMDYRVNIFLRQRWNDPRLRLPTDFKSDALTVDPKMFQCLWKPDLFFANEKNANFHDTCVSVCVAVGYTTRELVFMWQSDPVQMDEISLPQFDIRQEDIKYGNCTKYYQGTGHYTCVEVIFTLRRQVGFYMMGVYAPTLLTVVLSWLSFWINPDASAARVPLGLMSLASQLPKVSYVKALDIWLITCLMFGFLSLVEFAVVQVQLFVGFIRPTSKLLLNTTEYREIHYNYRLYKEVDMIQFNSVYFCKAQSHSSSRLFGLNMRIDLTNRKLENQQ